MTNYYEYCRDIIAAATGDNLERCLAAFRDMSEDELDQPYGESGQTHRLILQSYQEERERNNAALEWFAATARQRELLLHAYKTVVPALKSSIAESPYHYMQLCNCLDECEEAIAECEKGE